MSNQKIAVQEENESEDILSVNKSKYLVSVKPPSCVV